MFKKSIFLVAILSLVFLSACSLNKEKELSLEEARAKAQQFINDNFMDPSFPVEIVNIEKDGQTGLYKFSIDLGGEEPVESYISRDAKVLFPQAYNITELEESLSIGDNEADSQISVEEDISALDSGDLNGLANFDSNGKAVIYFFWGDGCPHCSNQKIFMDKWSSRFPGIEIKSYETWNDSGNKVILDNMARAYGTSAQGVPMTFIGDKYWVGYSDSLGSEMEVKIKECLEKNCENPGNRIK